MYLELLEIQRCGWYSPRNRVVSFKSYRALRSNLPRHVVCISCSRSCFFYEKYTWERISQERTELFLFARTVFCRFCLRIWREICAKFRPRNDEDIAVDVLFCSFFHNARILKTFLLDDFFVECLRIRVLVNCSNGVKETRMEKELQREVSFCFFIKEALFSW